MVSIILVQDRTTYLEPDFDPNDYCILGFRVDSSRCSRRCRLLLGFSRLSVGGTGTLSLRAQLLDQFEEFEHFILVIEHEVEVLRGNVAHDCSLVASSPPVLILPTLHSRSMSAANVVLYNGLTFRNQRLQLLGLFPSPKDRCRINQL